MFLHSKSQLKQDNIEIAGLVGSMTAYSRLDEDPLHLGTLGYGSNHYRICPQKHADLFTHITFSFNLSTHNSTRDYSRTSVYMGGEPRTGNWERRG
ncbi:hypothetical protein VNI00_014185 [Paramarasmius palmivorus]|uniref:Uncharacterized protein n=1 Tax=Paramarasmius palmivorus TaxID=297713 RepID=A0AAW0BUA4_9AGAR